MARIKKSPAVGRKGMSMPEPKPRACHECKRQKIFCSKHLPKCERCQLKSLDCSYAGPKKIRVNEDKLRYVKAKLERYEEIFKSLPPEILSGLPEGLSPPTAVPEGHDDDGDEDGIEDNDLEIEPADDGLLPEQFRQMNLYLKASRGSADTFFKVASRMSGLHHGSVSTSEHDTDHNHDPDHVHDSAPRLLSRRPHAHHDLIQLPPIDVARHYFFSQHMYIGTIFAFTDPDTFEKQLAEAYDRPSPPTPGLDDQHTCLAYAKILMILALGRMYSVNRSSISHEVKSDDEGYDHPPGFAYFTHALALLPEVHEPLSILGVETFAYVGYFLQNLNRRDAAFLYVGIALRMAISLGLHQEAPSTSPRGKTDLPDAEKEHRRRVWWSIYSLDRILSLKSGRPISILDEDIAVHMPSQLLGESVDSPVVVLCCYTELSRILGEINTLIYRSSSSKNLVRTVHSILQKLLQWEDALPKSLRLDPDRGKLARESISMYLHYYQCINMTARPLLFHVVQGRVAAIRQLPSAKNKDWQSGLSEKTAAVIRACISAARNTVQFMSKAAEHNMVATYGYMDGEHAFSAAIVLALVYATFPADATTEEATTKGLALLRRMGDLGNSYVASRYEQLARLQAIFGSQFASERDGAATQTGTPPEPMQAVAGVEYQPTVRSLPAQEVQQLFQPHFSNQQMAPQPPSRLALEQHLSQDFGPDLPSNFGLDLDLDLDIADIDSSGILFMNPTAEPGQQVLQNQTVRSPGHMQSSAGTGTDVANMNSLEADYDETAMWTTAFTNPAAAFDISLLIPEDAYMDRYFVSN